VILEPRFGTRSVFLLHTQFRDIEPKIWRRVMVPGSLTLAKLHLVIQGAFDWEDHHLHRFEVHDLRYGPVDDDYDEELLDENEWRLFQLLRVGDRFIYHYDFGDNWIHDIEVKGAENTTRSLKNALCLDGARARPPEDVGGVSGFEHFLEVTSNPRHKEYVDYVQWHGERFKPDLFSLFDTNARIQSRS